MSFVYRNPPPAPSPLRAALAAALPTGPQDGRPRTVPEPIGPALAHVEDRRQHAGERALRPAPEPAARSI